MNANVKAAEKALEKILAKIDRAIAKGKDCSELHRQSDEATLYLASVRG